MPGVAQLMTAIDAGTVFAREERKNWPRSFETIIRSVGCAFCCASKLGRRGMLFLSLKLVQAATSDDVTVIRVG